MLINPYLLFNGQCQAAFLFYAKCLRGNIEAMIRHRDTPIADQAPADWQDKIMHATLIVGDQQIAGSDAPLHMQAKPAGFMVTINPDTADDAKRIYAAFAEGGDVQMELQETFWLCNLVW